MTLDIQARGSLSILFTLYTSLNLLRVPTCVTQVVDYHGHERNLKYAISRAEHPVTTSNKESMYNVKGDAHTEAY